MAVSLDSTRIKFGAELRKQRERAQLTQNQLARGTHLSQAQISAIERGSKGTNEENIRRFDEILNTGGRLLRRWQDGHGRLQGVALWFEDHLKLEEEATELHQYQPMVIPGLLQTEDYATAVIRSGMEELTETQLAQAVQARLKRQEILKSEAPPWFRIVLDEPWLHRPFGGSEVMRGQLESLLVSSSRPRISVQVIPMRQEFHPGHDGAFRIHTLPGRGQAVYVESRGLGTVVDDSETVEDYKRIFMELRGAALPQAESRELISKIIEEFQ